ncbi:hypothetical protein [Herpetosiphon giganteus]|uniref:hypothetical protein n=1 Tax=Herpetosiphon giganteus TaxID=2029754 RepID=UPI001959FDB6|nr:hypothetical protein [Herpetosiphon giganteus]MBM7846541.1 hypothetical protein [Herpetosiphon giganteus]
MSAINNLNAEIKGTSESIVTPIPIPAETTNDANPNVTNEAGILKRKAIAELTMRPMHIPSHDPRTLLPLGSPANIRPKPRNPTNPNNSSNAARKGLTRRRG